MRIHLEGMGVSGSLLARKLLALGIEFTWHDLDLPVTAWKASTGAIYPAGSTKFGPDWSCYLVWQQWYEQGFCKPWVEAARYIFAHKSPPHEGRYSFGPVAPKYTLNAASVPSYHLNAQGLVRETQALLAHLRLPAAPIRGAWDHYVVTHGYGHRLGYYYWGWTRLVTLDYDPVFVPVVGHRPCFYFRPNKFVMAYAYPVPNTPWWYAGSSIIKQGTFRALHLDMPSKYERWKSQFEHLAQGSCRVAGEGEYLEGWRPASRDEDWVQSTGRVHALRPLWNSGIRHFPKQWAHAAQALGLPISPAEESLLC